jgi:glycosyltransferase involved in cell wall biosynthesis
MDQNDAMRILHVITALGVGGAEHMLLKLLGAPALAGVEQRVLALLPGGKLAQAMRATGAAVDELDLLGGIPVLGGSLAVVAQARRHRPDLVQGWLYHGNLGAWLAARALGRRTPLLWGVRQSLPSLAGENAFARVAIHLNRWFSGRPDRLLFNSQLGAEHHRAFGFDMRQALVIPNGFDTERLAPDPAARLHLRAAWGVRTDEVVYGLLARHHPVKDHVGFLRAARQVLDARPGSRFVLAGTGIDAHNPILTRQVAEAGLPGAVHLLGERHDVPEMLSAMDVYVSASRAEAFSNAVGEAMSCGVPCVVTSVGDSAQVVGDTGFVVPPAEPDALAKAMVALADVGEQGRRERGALARVRIRDRYSLDAIAGRYAALYQELLAARAAPQPRA